MAYGKLTASTTAVYTRNSGQFAKACSVAAEKTAMEVAEKGARVSRRMAPSGSKPDKRPEHRVKLKKSIKVRRLGKAKAQWGSTSGHALHVEFGTSPHWMVGKYGFFWDNAGKLFYWADKKYDNWTEERGVVIWHPGAKAQAFLYPAYEKVAKKKQMLKVAKRNFPG